jgi:hypothetical protein
MITEHRNGGCWTLTETILQLVCLDDAWHSKKSWAAAWWNVSGPWSSWWGMTPSYCSSHITHVEISLEYMVSTLNTQSQTLTIPESKTLELCEQGSMFNSMIFQKFRNWMKGSPYQLMHQLWSGPGQGSQIDTRSARMSWHNNNQLLHNYGPRLARYSKLQHWDTCDTNTQWTVWCSLNHAHINYTFNDCNRIANTFLQLGLTM